MDSQQLLTKTLKQHNHSLTKARRAVFVALQDKEPQTMRELMRRVQSADRASVYRTINLFERLGIVRRLQIGWKYKLELSDIFSHHHHHMTCSICGKIEVIKEDRSLEKQILSLAHRYGYLPGDHQLEIRGICRSCQQKGHSLHS